jgi:hypothetical protein
MYGVTMKFKLFGCTGQVIAALGCSLAADLNMCQAIIINDICSGFALFLQAKSLIFVSLHPLCFMLCCVMLYKYASVCYPVLQYVLIDLHLISRYVAMCSSASTYRRPSM